MLWSIVLIATVLFMFSVFFMQACTDYLERDGEDGIKISRPLEEMGWPIYGAFILYIGFYQCVVANTLTSLFVESTMANASKDQQQCIQAELENKDRYVHLLKSWYEAIDTDESGQVTYAEIVDSLDA